MPNIALTANEPENLRTLKSICYLRMYLITMGMSSNSKILDTPEREERK